MSQYRQQYVTPYSGGLAAGAPGSPLSDAFDNVRPAFEIVPGAPAIPGYAALEAKWQLCDPGSTFQYAAVDTRLQMAFLQGAGKGVCGMFQQIPYPLGDNPPGTLETIDLVIYAQSRVSALYTQPESAFAAGPSMGGIFLADDLVAAPDTSGFLFAGDFCFSGSGEVQRSTECAQFVAYDALPSSITQAEQDFGYKRIRLRQTHENGFYNARVTIEVGSWGSDWLRAAYLEYVDLPSVVFKSCGFGVWPNTDTVCQLQVDNFYVTLEPYAPGFAGAMGGTQQLGSV